MSKRGPKPMVGTLRRLVGKTRSSQSLGEDAPVASGDPKAPAWLSSYAKQVWRRTLASMPPGTYTTADEPTLIGYCQACDLLKASAEASADGYFGEKRLAPCAQGIIQASNTIVRLGNVLGLNPTARDQLKRPESQADDWDGLLQ